MVNARDLSSRGEIRVGSNPTSRTRSDSLVVRTPAFEAGNPGSNPGRTKYGPMAQLVAHVSYSLMLCM